MYNERVIMLFKGIIFLFEYIYFWSKLNNVSVLVYFKEILRVNVFIIFVLYYGIMGKGKYIFFIRYKINNRE